MVAVVPPDERPSVAIIGAGPSGLAAAHHLADSHRVWLFDTRSDVGGVWAHSSHQAYPWLETNTPTALFPFPGFPMVSDDWIEEKGRETGSSSKKHTPPYVSGQTAQRYYARFAKEKNLVENGRLERLRLSTKVTKIRRPDQINDDKKSGPSPAQGWLLTCSDVESGQEETHPFDRIVIATGSFSAPSIPSSLNAHTPNGNFLYHSSDLGSSDFDSRLTHASKVVIIGGGKSALDLIAFLTRSSSAGNGSNVRRSIVLLLPPHQHISALPVPHGRIPSYLSRLSLFGSRYLSPWSGCSSASYSSSSSSSSIGLEKSRIGHAIRKLYWSALSRQVSSNFAALIPHPSKDAFDWHSMLRSTARLFPAPPGLSLSSGQEQQAADFSVLRGSLGDVVTSSKMGETTLHLTLADGSAHSLTLESQKDVVVACTGYLPSSSSMASLFEDEREAKRLGIPTPGGGDAKDANWKLMVTKAIDEARSDSPLLTDLYTREELCANKDLDTFRLYHHMIPLEQAYFHRDNEEEMSPPSRDFAVVGLPQTLSASIVADVQARWLARFFSNDGGEGDSSFRLPRSQGEAAIQTSRLVAASIARYGLRDARQGTTMSLELAWYCNSLLSDMESKGVRQTHPLKALGADDFL